jgi:putative DNA primase/helicase
MTAEMIPTPLRDWLVDIARRMQCSLDFPAVGAVVALATIVGRQMTIRPKARDDWVCVPNLWGGIVGRPGFMKTPALQAVLRVLDRFVEEAQEEYGEGLAEYKTKLAVKKARVGAAREDLKKAAKKKEATDADLAKLAREAVPDMLREEVPTLRRYVVNDTTVEKLGVILQENPNGVLLFRDELTGFLKTLDKFGHESDRAFFLESWNGQNPFTYDRIERGTVFIPAVVVSILGGIQPGPLGRYLRGASTGTGEEDDGLIQRFQLVVYPDQPEGWQVVDEPPDAEARDRAYAVYEALNDLDPAEVGAVVGDGDVALPYLHFADDAQDVFYEWWRRLEAKIRSGHEGPALESHLSKFRSLLPSLALLFHLVDVVDGDPPGPVSAEATGMAVAWCDFLEAHARRIYALGTGADTEPARRLAERIKEGDVNNPFTAREIARKAWSGLTQSEDVSIAIGLLELNGWVYGVERSPGPEGGRRTTVYHLNPRLRGNEPQRPRTPPAANGPVPPR